jgi:hypothetical protein
MSKKEKDCCFPSHLRLAELFFAEESEVADADNDLEDHTDPESRVAETFADIVGHRWVIRQRSSRC